MDMDYVNLKLQEMIIDENRIVNYKTLSKLCSLHVNLAKDALKQFLDSEKNINACYLLAGCLKDTNSSEKKGAYHVAVVPEAKLEKLQDKFSYVDSCHVYSLQKATIKDSSSLYCANDSEFLPTEQTSLRPVIQNPMIGKVSRNKPTPSSAPNKVIKTENFANKTKEMLPKSEPNLPIKTSPLQKDGSGGDRKSKQTNGKAPQGIMAAFAKGKPAAKKTPTPANNKAPPKKVEIKKEPVQKTSPNESKVKKSTAMVPKPEVKKAEKEMWSSNSGESSDEEEVIPPPKRVKKVLSRIKQLPESDSEDEEVIKKKSTESSQDSEEPLPKVTKKKHLSSDEEDEDMIPPTPEKNESFLQVTTVTNTYQDEDGFLVTRKEKQLEEVKVTPPPAPVRKVVSKDTHPAKKKQKKSPPEDGKKQASLMSFFKKK